MKRKAIVAKTEAKKPGKIKSRPFDKMKTKKWRIVF